MNAYAHTPPRDRRQGRRILTMRNAMYAALAILVVFTLITVASELRKPVAGKYGRLYETRPAVTDIKPRQAPVVVEEGKIIEYSNADPLTIDAANREQILGVQNPVNPVDAARDAEVQAAIQTSTSFTPQRKLSLEPVAPGEKKKARFAISGGSGGVYTAPTTTQ